MGRAIFIFAWLIFLSFDLLTAGLCSASHLICQPVNYFLNFFWLYETTSLTLSQVSSNISNDSYGDLKGSLYINNENKLMLQYVWCMSTVCGTNFLGNVVYHLNMHRFDNLTLSTHVRAVRYGETDFARYRQITPPALPPRSIAEIIRCYDCQNRGGNAEQVKHFPRRRRNARRTGRPRSSRKVSVRYWYILRKSSLQKTFNNSLIRIVIYVPDPPLRCRATFINGIIKPLLIIYLYNSVKLF